MGRLKSKQIHDFNDSINGLAGWSATTNNEIPNARDIADNFVPEYALVVEEFIGLTIASTSAWSLTLSNNVSGDHIGLISVYVNGVKLKRAAFNSVSGTTLSLNAIDYDIDAQDVIEIHYVQAH